MVLRRVIKNTQNGADIFIMAYYTSKSQREDLIPALHLL